MPALGLLLTASGPPTPGVRGDTDTGKDRCRPSIDLIAFISFFMPEIEFLHAPVTCLYTKLSIQGLQSALFHPSLNLFVQDGHFFLSGSLG